jgi:hypothetical protein
MQCVRERRVYDICEQSHQIPLQAPVAQWRPHALSALSAIAGLESDYYRQFEEHCKPLLFGKYKHAEVLEGVGVLKGAKSDLEAGYIFDVEQRIAGDILPIFSRWPISCSMRYRIILPPRSSGDFALKKRVGPAGIEPATVEL